MDDIAPSESALVSALSNLPPSSLRSIIEQVMARRRENERQERELLEEELHHKQPTSTCEHFIISFIAGNQYLIFGCQAVRHFLLSVQLDRLPHPTYTLFWHH